MTKQTGFLMQRAGKYEIERRIYFGTRRFVNRFLDFCKDNSIYFPRYIIQHLIREQELVLKHYPRNINDSFNIIKDKKILNSIFEKKNNNLELTENEKNVIEIYEIREKIKSTLSVSMQFLKARDDNNYDLKEIYHILSENKEIIELTNKTQVLEEKRNQMFNKLIKSKENNPEKELELEKIEQKIFELQEKQFKNIKGDISFIMGLFFLVFLSKEFEVLPKKKIEELKQFIEKRWKIERSFQLY